MTWCDSNNNSNGHLFDPACDAAHPKVLHIDSVLTAADRIKDVVMRTPCQYSNALSRLLDMDVYLKLDYLQVTGSFKERGARNALMLLSQEQRVRGVIAASAGNHAQALAYHGQLLGVPVTVVMPVTAPLVKITRCRAFGATVIIVGDDLSESREYALRMSNTNSLIFDHLDILAGAGTMGTEIIDDVPNVHAILVPAGGGGLIAGVAVAVKHAQPSVKIIAVEAENCASFANSMKHNCVTHTQPAPTLADGLSVAVIGVNAFATAKPLIDKCVDVNEAHIALAILRLIEYEKIIVEGAAAVGLAALTAGRLPELKGKRVVLVLSGCNIDTVVLARCIDRGLALDGRLVCFEVVVSDRPGGLVKLVTLLASSGINIRHIDNERASYMTDAFSVRVKVTVDTRDREHLHQLEAMIRTNFNEVTFEHVTMPTAINA